MGALVLELPIIPYLPPSLCAAVHRPFLLDPGPIIVYPCQPNQIHQTKTYKTKPSKVKL